MPEEMHNVNRCHHGAIHQFKIFNDGLITISQDISLYKEIRVLLKHKQCYCQLFLKAIVSKSSTETKQHFFTPTSCATD